MSETRSSTTMEQEYSKQETEQNWSEKVEDLVESGAVDDAITFVESLTPNLEIQSSPESQQQALRLAAALRVLSGLYESKGLTLKADEARIRALSVENRSSLNTPPLPQQRSGSENARKESGEVGSSGMVDSPQNPFTKGKEVLENEEGDASLAIENPQPGEASSDDDWEARADLEPDKLLPSPLKQKLKEISLEDTAEELPKRRGRGNFTYMRRGLYSDQLSEESDSCEDLDKPEYDGQEYSDVKDNTFGTRHVLVLDGLSSSTTTTDLENLLKDFNDSDFSIRWVNLTVALAVFRTASDANDACRDVRFPCAARVLEEDDVIMKSLLAKDLEPPKQRPKTSAQVAQRLIAQGMGIKISSPTFGTRELRKQEEERKNRIITRQTMKNDAWGSDD